MNRQLILPHNCAGMGCLTTIDKQKQMTCAVYARRFRRGLLIRVQSLFPLVQLDVGEQEHRGWQVTAKRTTTVVKPHYTRRAGTRSSPMPPASATDSDAEFADSGEVYCHIIGGVAYMWYSECFRDGGVLGQQQRWPAVLGSACS